MKKFVTYIDPPEGWKYGFPKIYNADEHELISDWLVDNGYPESLVEQNSQWCRFWQEEVDTDD